MATQADGSVRIDVKLDTSTAEKNLQKLTEKIEKSEKNIESIRSKRNEANKKSIFSAAELDAEKEKLHQIKQELQRLQAISNDKSYSPYERASARRDAAPIRGEVAEQQARVTALQTEYNKLYNSVEKYDQKLEEATEALETQKQEAGELVQQINSISGAQKAMAAAQEKVNNATEKFGERMKRILINAFVYNLISAGLRGLKDWMSKVINSNDEARASTAKLKGALLTLAQPLVSIVIPAFTLFVAVLTRVVSAIAQVFAMLSGGSIESSKKAAEALSKQTSELESTGEAADEAAGSLAGFDEINQIMTETSESVSGSSSSSEITPDFDFETDLSTSRLEDIVTLVELIGAGLAAWAIGDNLGLSLGKTLGLAAAIYYTIELVRDMFSAWQDGVDWENLASLLLDITALVTGLGIAFGGVGAGIGLIASGLASLILAFHDAEENGWNLYNTFLAIAGFLATGIGIFVLTGQWFPVLIAGIASILLALVTTFGDGEALIADAKKIIQGFIDFFKGIVTGDFELTMQGVAEIFNGLRGIVDNVFDAVHNAIDSFFDWLDEKTDGKLTWLLNFIRGILHSILELFYNLFGTAIDFAQGTFEGMIKFFKGIIQGDWALMWDGFLQISQSAINFVQGILDSFAQFFGNMFGDIFNALTGIWEDIRAWWADNAEEIFTLEYWKNLGKNMIDGLLQGLKSIFTGLTSWASNVWSTITSAFSSKNAKSSISNSTNGVSVQSLDAIPAVSIASIPHLASGAVIPANREFLAVLGDQSTGTNIETPLATMVDAFKQAFTEVGGGGGYTFTVNLDGREVARNQVKHINDMTRERGAPVILV